MAQYISAPESILNLTEFSQEAVSHEAVASLLN